MDPGGYFTKSERNRLCTEKHPQHQDFFFCVKPGSARPGLIPVRSGRILISRSPSTNIQIIFKKTEEYLILAIKEHILRRYSWEYVRDISRIIMKLINEFLVFTEKIYLILKVSENLNY